MDYFKVRDICLNYEINSWSINKQTGLIDVHEGVIISGKGLFEIPLPFGKVHSYFDCSDNNLKSLKNAPIYTKGMFNCSRNYLTSMEYCPKQVGGLYALMNNFKKRNQMINATNENTIYARCLWKF